MGLSGRYWIRTSDFHRVKMALVRYFSVFLGCS